MCSPALSGIASDVTIITESSDDPGDAQVYYAAPYTIVDGHRIYSCPPYFKIGQDNLSGFGVQPESQWETNVDSAGVAFKAKRIIRDWLSARPAISYLD
jgi:hypothetical protein